MCERTKKNHVYFGPTQDHNFQIQQTHLAVAVGVKGRLLMPTTPPSEQLPTRFLLLSYNSLLPPLANLASDTVEMTCKHDRSAFLLVTDFLESLPRFSHVEILPEKNVIHTRGWILAVL